MEWHPADSSWLKAVAGLLWRFDLPYPDCRLARRYRKLGKAEGDARGEPAIKPKTEFSASRSRLFRLWTGFAARRQRGPFMIDILKFVEGDTAFDPETVQLLASAFEDTWTDCRNPAIGSRVQAIPAPCEKS